jgi:hypothetical protein
MQNVIVKYIEDQTGRRRVVIYRREDDRYAFTEERWSDDPYEQCWISHAAPAICDCEETALREARGRIVWLRDP